jgi:hypothetical protein
MSESSNIEGAKMPDQSEQTTNARQDALLEEAMKQPGVSALMDAYSHIEAAYVGATAATAVAPVVITTNTAR